MQPIMLGRTLSTLDHMLEGRLTVNIMSNFPGQTEPSPYRYKRSRSSRNTKTSMDPRRNKFEGNIYNFQGLSTDPQDHIRKAALFIFWRLLSDALELCGQHCDVYLMPEKLKTQKNE